MIVLGLESTCDESGAAIIQDGQLLVNVVKSQIPEHAFFGGVVPEVASRLHLRYLSPAIQKAFEKTGLGLKDIDLISVANRPGLMGCLLVGNTIAKSLSYLLQKPLVHVDHLLGHLLAPDLEEKMIFPCIGGIFSGGHCNIYRGESPLDWSMLSRTRDDAPGEAFDKVASLLNLSYPGGPAVQKFAEQGDEKRFKLPSPLAKKLNGDFSFSGLKTSVLYQVKGQQGKEAIPVEEHPDLAASFQYTVAEALTKRLIQTAQEHQINWIYVGGGVAANARLRQELKEQCAQKGLEVRFPSLPLCMDNGAMIAHAGHYLYEAGQLAGLEEDVSSRSVLGIEINS